MSLSTSHIACLLLLSLTTIAADTFTECEQMQLESFVPVPDNCLAYVFCNGSSSYSDLCPMGTYFDEVQQRCAVDEHYRCYLINAGGDNAAAVLPFLDTTKAPSGAVSTANANAAATTEPMPTTAHAGARPHCQRQLDEYFPHPLRCEYFYRCLQGYLTVQRCNFHYGWDYVQQICVPIEGAKCYRPLNF